MIEHEYFQKDGSKYGVEVKLFCEPIWERDNKYLWRIRVTKKPSKKRPHKELCQIDIEPGKTEIDWHNNEPEPIPTEWIGKLQEAIISRLRHSVVIYVQSILKTPSDE